MEYFSAVAEAFLERGSAYGANHEFLERDGSVGVAAAVDDVHHRHGECVCVRTADVTVEGQVEVSSCCFCHCERNAENSVSAEFRLGLRTVECYHCVVNLTLCEHAHAFDCGSDNCVYVLNSFEYAFAAIAFLVAVAELESFVFAG